MSRTFKVVQTNEPITETELEFLRQLAARNTKFMVVGMTSAILQGADTSTKDIDLWFEKTSDGKLARAAAAVGGVFMWRASSRRLNPPCLGGQGLERFDVVNNLHGLGDFASEYRQSLEIPVEDFAIKILPIERVIASKRAANRDKDRAVLPALLAALAALKYTR